MYPKYKFGHMCTTCMTLSTSRVIHIYVHIHVHMLIINQRACSDVETEKAQKQNWNYTLSTKLN